MDIESLLNILNGVRKRRDCYYQAKCPSHEDNDPSLSVWISDCGKINIKCWAGCDVHAIMNSLGLRVSDLYPNDPYWKAAKQKMSQRHIDPLQLDRTVIEIAQADIRAGKTLSLNDKARLELAIRRLEENV